MKTLNAASCLLSMAFLSGCWINSQTPGQENAGGSPLARDILGYSVVEEDLAAPTAVQLPIKCGPASSMHYGVTCKDSTNRIIYTINFTSGNQDWGLNDIGSFQTPMGGTRVSYDASFNLKEVSTDSRNCIGGDVQIRTFGSGNHAVPFGDLVEPCAHGKVLAGTYHVVDNFKYDSLNRDFARHNLTFGFSSDYAAVFSVTKGRVVVKVWR